MSVRNRISLGPTVTQQDKAMKRLLQRQEIESLRAQLATAQAKLAEVDRELGIVRADQESLKGERDRAWAEDREVRAAIAADSAEATIDEVRRVVAQRTALLALVREAEPVIDYIEPAVWSYAHMGKPPCSKQDWLSRAEPYREGR